jgi:hypothetical protein
MFLDNFDMLISKIIFFKIKNIILMHFRAKSTLKNNCYHIPKHSLSIGFTRKGRSRTIFMDEKRNHLDKYKVFFLQRMAGVWKS